MRTAEGARAKLRGEPYEDQRQQDRDAVDRSAKAESVDLEGEAQRAKVKLKNVERTRE